MNSDLLTDVLRSLYVYISFSNQFEVRQSNSKYNKNKEHEAFEGDNILIIWDDISCLEPESRYLCGFSLWSSSKTAEMHTFGTLTRSSPSELPRLTGKRKRSHKTTIPKGIRPLVPPHGRKLALFCVFTFQNLRPLDFEERIIWASSSKQWHSYFEKLDAAALLVTFVCLFVRPIKNTYFALATSLLSQFYF